MRRRNLGVPEQLANHRQRCFAQYGNAGERVPQIKDPKKPAM
jgi:hypothetical protein